MILHINTEAKTISVDGITIAFEILKTIVNPDKKTFYTFERFDNRIVVTKFPCVDLSKSATESAVTS